MSKPLTTRLEAKKKIVAEIRKYASNGLAEELKAKYRPAPKPQPEAPAADEPDVDVASLDEATLQQLLGE